MRWSLGRALPAHVLAQLSAQEKDFFKEYDRVLMKYMKDVCDGLPLDITLDQRPPPAKDNNIRVRVITEPENDIGAPQPLTPSHSLSPAHPPSDTRTDHRPSLARALRRNRRRRRRRALTPRRSPDGGRAEQARSPSGTRSTTSSAARSTSCRWRRRRS